MPRISSVRIKNVLAEADIRRQKESSAAHRQRKGLALENLICEIFELVPGVEVVARNVTNVGNTQEVDILFWNRRLQSGLYHVETPFLVECKNWSRPVSAQAIIQFSAAMQRRACRDGILVACGGITGSPGTLTESYYEIAMALSRERRILVINRLELEAMTHTNGIAELLKKKILELATLSTLR